MHTSPQPSSRLLRKLSNHTISQPDTPPESESLRLLEVSWDSTALVIRHQDKKYPDLLFIAFLLPLGSPSNGAGSHHRLGYAWAFHLSTLHLPVLFSIFSPVPLSSASPRPSDSANDYVSADAANGIPARASRADYGPITAAF